MAGPSRTPPPVICINDRMLLEYALLDDSVGLREGHHTLFVGDKEVGRVPCLAISQDKESHGVTFYCCDEEWQPIAIAAMGSVEHAKRTAERIYPGSSTRWIHARFTADDVARYLEEAFADSRCSFCGRRADETIAATFEGSGNTRICGECIARFYRELSEPSTNEPR